MKHKALTFSELKELINYGIEEIEELQGTLEGEQFRQAEHVSQALETVRFMLKDKVLFYDRKREQKRIDELTK
ncbi:hypothetical protein J2T50_001904 [Streptococcus gallinaceus]|uniref:hypothetical protein n=1 Tax=Streptococcus gallinaceus TaxID=165758 RepID=UPI00209D19FF|nr:hypothetical protein [Streptococcus gallinaceus]MCP1640181.1 hypothetical protein [Streptococcus gallinaceus]MCP1770963.1 hypothetical protein [Streptococcus gallinaceus]